LRFEVGAKTVVDERDLWPDHRFTTTVLVARRSFVDKHPEAVESLLRAHAGVIQWIAGHGTQAQKIANSELARLTGKPLSERVLGEAWSKVSFTTD
ncbi:ABC transporter substrate-binding protein, partial [Klebsiella pneumoniae]|uniref:ABC transporter substrate-binding protein n=1 Tax=Klebsiella pneumoniae TaxID=573 RepID=UPI003EE2F55B